MHEADSFDRTEITPDGAQPDGAPDQSEAANGKGLVHYTSDEFGTGDASAGVGHNIEAVAEGHFDEAGRKTKLASGSSFDGLVIHFEIGWHLGELKKLVPHGSFEREVQRRLGFKKGWRTRLMKLAEERPEIMKALEWAKADNQLTRSEFSVDGALALLKRWQHKANGVNNGSAKQKSFTDSFIPNETFKKKTDIVEFLKQLIVFLRDEVTRLEQRNAFLEAELSRWDVTVYPDAPCPNQFALELQALEVAGQ